MNSVVLSERKFHISFAQYAHLLSFCSYLSEYSAMRFVSAVRCMPNVCAFDSNKFAPLRFSTPCSTPSKGTGMVTHTASGSTTQNINRFSTKRARKGINKVR